MRIEAVIGDITTENVDAIVNAANSTLLGGGGVDGAIHRAAGPRLLEACQKVRATELPDGLPVGRAVATPGFDLPATWVIHTVGPNRHAGEDDPVLLRACFDGSLELAIQLGCSSIALPAVSAGVYGRRAALPHRSRRRRPPGAHPLRPVLAGQPRGLRPPARERRGLTRPVRRHLPFYTRCHDHRGSL